MKANPRYPNRPTHADFDLISRLVRRQDTITANAPEALLQSLIAQCIDPDTARYVADNQGIMFVQRMDQMVFTPREVQAAVGGAFMTGLVLGIQFEQERARNQPPLPDA